MLGGIGRSTAYAMIAAGEVETVKISARRLLVIESIRARVERLRAAS
jgi:predicted protein tyrosine phosphatase